MRWLICDERRVGGLVSWEGIIEHISRKANAAGQEASHLSVAGRP
jgi:hypothetical protein